MAKTLTAAAVDKLRPSARRQEIRDAGQPGLYLVIQPSGAKSWAMRFRRPNGKSAKLTLGVVDLSRKEAESEPILGQPLTLAAARALAAEIGRQRARDRDVVAEYSAAKRRRRITHLERSANTFGRAARDFIEGYAMKKTRRWREQAHLLGLRPTGKDLEVIRGGLADRWGDKPIAEIDGHDIYGVIEETRRSGAPGLERRAEGVTESRARAMLSCLSRMFRWLAQHRRVEQNPCAGVHRPDAPQARDRVLNFRTDVRNADELRWFWSAASVAGEPFGAMLKLLLLTGCRLSEIAQMTGGELSDDLATLRLKGVRTKNGRPHDVPLPRLAREILSTVKRIEGCQYIFSTNGETPISGFSKMKARLDLAMLALAKKETGKESALAPWRLHDLRRTCATGMASIGISPHIVEAALNHISGAKAGVAGTYNLADYLTERKAALERWAGYVESLLSKKPVKIVPLAPKRRA